MKTELQYKRIPGFSKYSIREDGKEVLSHIRYPEGKPLIISFPNKYKAQIVLQDDNGNKNKYSIFYLVAKTFIPNPNNHPLVIHIENDENHHYKNLKWYSGSDEHEILIWKEIEKFPGYIVSEYGHVVSNKFIIPKILKIFDRKDKIKTVKFSKDDKAKGIYLHYLIASVFLPNPNNYEHVIHINDIENNHYTNLKWNKTLKDFPDMEWKSIENYSGYKISEYGHIMSYYRDFPSIMSPDIRNNSKSITLFDNNERKYLSIEYLVAKEFIPNPNNYKYIIHLDGNTMNNYYKNLVWSEWRDIEDDEEEWRNIPDFPRYKVSNKGRFKSYAKKYPAILNLYVSEAGYPSINLYNEKGAFSYDAHRIIAEIFIPNPENKPFVDHIDRNKQNNHISNLRWVTPKENSNNIDKSNNPLSKRIAQLGPDGEIIRIFNSGSEAQKIMKCRGITNCARGFSKLSKGFKWKYIDEIEKNEPYKSKPDEIFKIVDGYYGYRKIYYPNYKISNYGNLVNIKTGIKKKMIRNVYGCYSLSYKGEGKSYKAHILVASFFIEGRTEERKYVNHRDENKLNPHYTNLEWVTQKENSIHSANMKRYRKVINELKEKFI